MEGPSLIIIKEELKPFKGQLLYKIEGNTKVDLGYFLNKKLKSIKTWGKHLLLEFSSKTIKIHFLMFGSYRINVRKEGKVERLRLHFKNQQINFYNCSVQILEGKLSEIYDWRVDVLSKRWSPQFVLQQLKEYKNQQVCDVLMEQDIFAGVGNIIKNEVLFNLKIHPEEKLKNIPKKQQERLVQEVRDYCEKFLYWKKRYELKKHWLVFRKRNCPECGEHVTKVKTGVKQRLSHFCESCQRLKLVKTSTAAKKQSTAYAR